MANVLLLLLFLSVAYADLSVDQIREMVTRIHEKREGISLSTLETTKEPFVKPEKEKNLTVFVAPIKLEELEEMEIVEKKEEIKLSLDAIMNGKAYINGQWRSIEDTIGSFTLKYIGKKGVVLRDNNQIKKLFLHKERDNLIVLEEKE